MKIQKLLTAGMLTLSLCAGMAIAADNEAEVKSTTDTSRNPITGTVTVKKTYKNNNAATNGAKDNKEVVEKKKYKTDGSVEAKKTTETSQQTGE